MKRYDHEKYADRSSHDRRGAEQTRRPTPGKVTLTSKLPGRSGPAVQRTRSVGIPLASPVQMRSAPDPIRDYWMDTAHRGLSAPLPDGLAPVQARGSLDADPAEVQEAAASGIRGSGSRLPYLDQIQASFGPSHDLGGVRAHLDGAATQASERIGADAYATGQDIAFRGQPDLHTAAHEAAHVVQQRAGVHLSGGVGQAGDAYERHADAVADRVVRGESAAALLDRGGGDFGQPSGSAAVQRLESGRQSEELLIRTGDLSTLGEGNDAATKFIHWPNTDKSGVTLGKGYDIGSRSRDQVVRELTGAGMPEDQAGKIAAGAGLKGSAAGQFVTANKRRVGEIARDVQRNLLMDMLPGYTASARAAATSAKADKGGANAASRERKEGAAAGTYVMSDAEWGSLHPAMVEFLTDLIYQGGYYLYDRIAKVNAALKQHNGDHLAQFQAVRELFTSGYMDRYAGTIGEGKGKGGQETFYGKNVNLTGKYRRNQIRVAYLDHVIAALESGKPVRVEMPGQAGSEAGGGMPGESSQGEAPAPEPPPSPRESESLAPPLPRPEPRPESLQPPLPRPEPRPERAPAERPQRHMVERGESLSRLAARFGVSIDALKQANASKLHTWGNVQGFLAGATIVIPRAATTLP
jgi:hypothetical protein